MLETTARAVDEEWADEMTVEFRGGEKEDDDDEYEEVVDEDDWEVSGLKVELVDDAYLLDLERLDYQCRRRRGGLRT